MVKRRWAGKTGFTIVELLIVIVVIAILAAITIVAYNGIQAKTYRSIVLGDLRNAWKKLDLARVDLGHYPQTPSEMPDGFKFAKSAYDQSQNDIYYCVDKENDTYAIGVRDKTIKGYMITYTGTVTENTSVSGSTTCAAVGKTWVSNATTGIIMGYDGTAQAWAAAWSWTN